MRRARPGTEPIPLAKLRPPDLQRGHVVRPELAARLAEVWDHPITLVSAPAGFGKTSAVVAALHGVEAGPACAALLAAVDHPYAQHLLQAFGPEVRGAGDAPSSDGEVGSLTDRERDVLGELATARTYERIAERLGVSVNTVRFHIKNVYSKLGVRTRLEAVERARRFEVLETPGHRT